MSPLWVMAQVVPIRSEKTPKHQHQEATLSQPEHFIPIFIYDRICNVVGYIQIHVKCSPELVTI